MKTIYRIARTELQTLFYSPVAWLIIIIFTFQVYSVFTGAFQELVRKQTMGYALDNVTMDLFAGWKTLFPSVQEYLYLYIPLLTMGLMCREFNSGSIKLLYSSPVTSTQIILGKYLAIMTYGLVLAGMLVLLIIFGFFTIESIDLSATLSGLLGIYLLICAYAAIGLFMSTLTSYQVVAAMGTLALLAILNFIGGVGQDIAFVRDITYWLALSGRADELISGLICSDDVLYFIVVIVLFLTLSIMKLQSGRQKRTAWMIAGRYGFVVAVAILLGYLSSLPSLMYSFDMTRTKTRTLTPNSQEIMEKLNGGLTITTYVNLLDQNYGLGIPAKVNDDVERFKRYIRFKPEIQMKYVYYYNNANYKFLDERYPDLNDRERAEKIAGIQHLDFKMFLAPEEIKKQIDLSGEDYRFVRLVERESGEKTFLRVFDDMQRIPFEAEITAAFKRLVTRLPKVAFLDGHGERSIKRAGDRDYSSFAQNKAFRYALINQGFDVRRLLLSEQEDISEDIDIIIIAELKTKLTDAENEKLSRYIARGGNLIIAAEPGRQENINPLTEQLGIRCMSGSLVQQSKDFVPDLIVSNPTIASGSMSYILNTMLHRELKVTMPGCAGLEVVADCGFTVIPWLMTDSKGCWNELNTTDFTDGKVELNEEFGEEEKSIPTALTLSRKINDKEQRIIILGDADCISNGELSMSRKNISSSNFSLINGMFFWLSREEVPIDVRRPALPDNAVKIGQEGMFIAKMLLVWFLPMLLTLCALIIWFKRKRR